MAVRQALQVVPAMVAPDRQWRMPAVALRQVLQPVPAMAVRRVRQSAPAMAVRYALELVYARQSVPATASCTRYARESVPAMAEER